MCHRTQGSISVGILLLAATLSFQGTGHGATATDPVRLNSPNGVCEIRVSLDAKTGAASYEVLRAGKVVIAASPMGVTRDDTVFASGLSIVSRSKIETSRETYELFCGPQPRIDHALNRRTVVLQNTNGTQLAIDLAASDEGVAFRYRFEETSGTTHALREELTAFNLSEAAQAWLQPYHAASQYTPAYEDFYFKVTPGSAPPDSRAKAVGWSFPALFHVPAADTWALLTESGTDESFCACHLSPGPNALYKIEFPLSDETTKGWTNRSGPEPRYTLPWTMPWRVVVLGRNAGEIALASLVTDLAADSRISDTTWIKPGRASWAWWAYPDGPNNADLFNRFTDFADDMGWEYTLFDAGWWKPGLKPISNHAHSKNIMPLAWSYASDFYTPEGRRRKLDEMKAAGVRGVKVDFWCSDRQEAIAAIQGLFQDAAARRMVVNLHGCTIPRGWQRTWPNFLTAEAVLGTECYFFEPAYETRAAELNTILPFTRNAVGPVDVTPVACSPKKYGRTTTAAHELAAALTTTSGLIHFADKPEFFHSLPPQALQVLRDAPTRWDETRCLEGEPGRVIVLARRAGKSWFVAGLNGTPQKLQVTLELSTLGKTSRRTLISEGKDPHSEIAVTTIHSGATWEYTFPPKGGMILRLDE